jgi:superfamily I DNA and RNA helicase
MDVIRGAYDKPVSTGRLISILGGAEIEGVLYTGYPIVGALDNKNSLDAVMVTPLHGMIIFDIVEESDVTDRKGTRDLLYNAMVSRLINVKGLSHGRAGLSFKLNVLTFAPAWVASKPEDPELINTPEQLLQFIQSARNVDNLDKYERILEAIQAITKLKQRAPRTTKKDSSKGALLNEIEKSISNLDRNQSKAVIETSLGIQRIRGLAGSGKTVILALKAAYLHAKYPDWKIGVTFYSRSLKNQFKELINKFTIEQKAEEPDWDKIKIMQAWGSAFR